MPNNALRQEVSPDSLARKHEVSDRRLRNVFLVGASAWFVLAFSLAVCGAAFHYLAESRPMQWMPQLGLLTAPDLKPLERFPGPNLNIDDDHGQRLALVAAQTADLNSYGWQDRSNGLAHIPIARARQLLLQRGFPTSTNRLSPAEGSALQLIQKIPRQP